ncbi:hypothetical protein OUZ56_004404 [Daphnia magna]|uniref:Uncharacterized protein n=1 Tax=Daphnia magna TaxID=35525 RepID=A0ABQ9YQ17_9CRUS|nr:hypothetical protein OUZ56_004404 [Daphnia magna]
MECTSPASAAPSVRGACQERMTERITKEQQKPVASTYKSPAGQRRFKQYYDMTCGLSFAFAPR